MSVIIQGDQVRAILSGIRVEKSATTIASGDQNLFTVSGGRVVVTNMIGEVTTVVGGTSPTLAVKLVSTVGGDVTISTATAVDADEVGTLYAVEGVNNALETGSSGVVESTAKQIVLAEGTVAQTGGGTSPTGAVAWTITYYPLDAGASIASA